MLDCLKWPPRISTHSDLGIEYLEVMEHSNVTGLRVDYQSGVDFRDVLFGGRGNDVLSGAWGADSDLLFGDEGIDRLHGGDGSDQIQGGDGNDILYGNAGDESGEFGGLFGGAGNDTLVGGAGSDFMDGGEGSDTYLLSPGDGSDRIRDTRGDNIVRFGRGVSPDSISLIQRESEGVNRIGIRYGFNDAVFVDDAAQGSASMLVFENGDSLNFQQVLAGSDADLDIEGTDDNDSLLDGGGDDTLTPGGGDDTVSLGEGHDVLAFNVGDGADEVSGSTDGFNTLRFGPGVALSEVSFTQDGDDLVVDLGAGDSIRLQDWDVNGPLIEAVVTKVSETKEWTYGSSGVEQAREFRI